MNFKIQDIVKSKIREIVKLQQQVLQLKVCFTVRACDF